MSPVEELRWLEYGQRLATRQRNVSASRASPDTGENLFRTRWPAARRPPGGWVCWSVAAHCPRMVRAPICWCSTRTSPLLAGRDAGHLLDTWMFAGNTNLVRDVMVDGEWVVRDFRHRDEERIAARYRRAVERLVAGA